jgi:hypothetical protein
VRRGGGSGGEGDRGGVVVTIEEALQAAKDASGNTLLVLVSPLQAERLLLALRAEAKLAKLAKLVLNYANECDYCIACGRHPSSGHGVDCPADDLPDVINVTSAFPAQAENPVARYERAGWEAKQNPVDDPLTDNELDQLRRMDGPPPLETVTISREVHRRVIRAVREIEQRRATEPTWRPNEPQHTRECGTAYRGCAPDCPFAAAQRP